MEEFQLYRSHGSVVLHGIGVISPIFEVRINF